MAHAVLRKFRQSPRKVRMVADMIRGRQVADAKAILEFQQRKAAKMLSKVLDSAVANAAANDKADADALKVVKITVDPGPVEKRWLARSMGRANRINRRTSNVTIVVDVTQE